MTVSTWPGPRRRPTSSWNSSGGGRSRPESVPAAPPPVGAAAADDVDALFAGLAAGRARRGPPAGLLAAARPGLQTGAGGSPASCTGEITESGDDDRALAAASLLEAAWRLDAALVPGEMVETLAAHPRYPARSCAANLLAGRAAVAPLEVPVEVLGRLASPSTEDWFVWAPAMAAVAELVVRRPDACVILESLAASADARDRYEAAAALLGVATIQAAAVPAGLAGQLAGDADPLVAAKAPGGRDRYRAGRRSRARESAPGSWRRYRGCTRSAPSPGPGLRG